MIKRALISVVMLLISSFIIAQSDSQKKIYKQNNLVASLGVNYNFTKSSGRALNFFSFYDYKEENYWEYDQYYPLLPYLNKDSAEWSISPSLSLHLDYMHFVLNSDFAIGINTLITRTYLSSIATSEVQGAVAKLYVQGYDYRYSLSPSLGYRLNKFYGFVNLNLSLGFKKAFDTYLIVSDASRNKTRFANDHDYFRDRDFTLGLGFGVNYSLPKGFNVGMRYNNYKVNISEDRSSILFSLHNFIWSNSLTLSLGYNILN